MILEKAWAKIHGDYLAIMGGLSHETFRDLTGAPAFMYQTSDSTSADIWSILMEGHMAVCGVSIENEEEGIEFEEIGLING